MYKELDVKISWKIRMFETESFHITQMLWLCILIDFSVTRIYNWYKEH